MPKDYPLLWSHSQVHCWLPDSQSSGTWPASKSTLLLRYARQCIWLPEHQGCSISSSELYCLLYFPNNISLRVHSSCSQRRNAEKLKKTPTCITLWPIFKGLVCRSCFLALSMEARKLWVYHVAKARTSSCLWWCLLWICQKLIWGFWTEMIGCRFLQNFLSSW